MSLSVAVGVADLTGHFRLFLPFEFLSTCQSNVPLASAAQYPAGLPWIFPVSAGFVDLSAEEIAQVGLEDILVAQRAPAILLPNEFRNGWSLAEDGSNSARFMIDKYFERGVSVDTSVEVIAAGGKPDVDALPLRLHVILAEKEFTLGEIRAFSPGSIVELDVTKTDPVRLMVNGKILGEGELVDVEGNLGVKVLRWRDS
jgi:type III secretion protein Q